MVSLSVLSKEIRVPIHRNGQSGNGWMRHLRDIMSRQWLSDMKVNADGTCTIIKEVDFTQNKQYVGMVGVGAKEFRMLLDTSLDYIWLANKNSNIREFLLYNVEDDHFYDCKSSQTCKTIDGSERTSSLEYSGGIINGQFVQERVSLHEGCEVDGILMFESKELEGRYV